MVRRKRRSTLSAVLVAAALVAVACSGCSNSASSNGGRTYTIGLITDATGPASSGNKSSVEGVKAGTFYAARNGYTIRFVLGDTATSPAGALTAAQRLVEQDHVLAVVTVSALLFGAASYLTVHGVPVLGAAEDGPEWLHAANMFGSYGVADFTKVTTLYGKFFKLKGVTTVGALGYGVSPSSSEAAKGAAASAQSVGLKVGYVNGNFPFGSTNVQPVALAMKSARIDGFFGVVDPNTGLNLVAALRDVGVTLKAGLLPTGYGGDITQGGPGGIQKAQGLYFLSSFQPVELHTAATTTFQSDLRQAGVGTEPTYAEYAAYAAMIMLTEGLKAAGKNPTHASLISALSGIHDFTAGGLLPEKIDLSQRSGAPPPGVPGCAYITKLVGSRFQPVSGASPLCGYLVPGKTVSASS